jgi:serine/threonine-protein kinase
VAKGKLTLSTTPWAEVYEGNRPLGVSPLVDFPLPAGKHQLRLVNAEKGLEKTISVDIKSGQTTALRQKL